ncbi:MAG TPA: COX15/CtaA family protein [Porticoccaceae bacterium]|nr:COX15/CtaA family protein [Porticoccaceae bacterium]
MALFNTPTLRKPGFKLVLAAFCLAIVVVVLGAFTRLVDAGLGCPDWPGCYGHLLWPVQDHHVERANEAWPDMPVDHAKTWPEMVHRYFAGTLGLFIVAIVAVAWKRREDAGYPFRLPLFLLFMVVWQALFGMWTVTLKLWPQIVTLHLLGGMTVLSLLWLLVTRLDNQVWRLPSRVHAGATGLKPWVLGAIVIVVCQIMLGGWTSSNYAAYACHDFPTCHGEWWPPMDVARGFDIFQTIGPNYLGGQLESDARVAIHFTHRLGAIAVTLYLLALCLRLATLGDRRLKSMAWVVLGALALQVALGISNVLFHIPLSLAVMHNAGGALLLLTLIPLAARLWMAEPEEHPA